MHIYCLGKDGAEAVTIGSLLWLPSGHTLSEIAVNEEALLRVCRPGDTKKHATFNSYIEEMKAHGPVKYVSDTELPEGCKRRRGFWENNGWK